MNPETAQLLIKQNLKLYDTVAENFVQTRAGKHGELAPLITHIKSGDRVLDLGSGSGNLFQLLKDRDVDYIGLDASVKLVEFCKKTFTANPCAQFITGDLLALPFPNNSFDAVYCMATFHHLPGGELREKALLEMHRVLKPSGKLVMTNWYWWRGPAVLMILKYWALKIFSTFTSPLLTLALKQDKHSHILKNVRMFSELDLGDIFVPWGKQGMRYYHSFRIRELKKLLVKTGFKNINQRVWPRAGDHWGKRNNLMTLAEK
jgi:ubiquinone/menaquinone biosynthesis C-methylase UbiE